MPEVVLIRPGCTDFDEQQRIQGSLELPLSSRGQAQVQRLADRLRDVKLDVIFSAPCEPARSTAIALCEECGSTFKELADFRNLNHGLWQGLQVEDVRRKYPRVFKQWQESPETVCLPEGETVAEAVERIVRALRKCLKRKGRVGIVASEPLATLISCVVRNRRPELPGTSGINDPENLIEFLPILLDERRRPRFGLQPAVPAPTHGDIPAPSKANGQNNGNSNGSGKNAVNGSSHGNGTPRSESIEKQNGHRATASTGGRRNGFTGPAVIEPAGNGPAVNQAMGNGRVLPLDTGASADSTTGRKGGVPE